MIYLQTSDLTADSYQQYITESIVDGENVADTNELKAIATVKTYLSDRYNTDAIFNAEEPIRSELLADIIAKITLYKIFRRNSARKVPTDTKEDYEWAIRQLEKLQAGKPILNELPRKVDTGGNPISNSIWGNNTNTDFYI